MGTWPVGIPVVFQTPVTVTLHSPNDRQMLAIKTVQGFCETVYVTIYAQLWFKGSNMIFHSNKYSAHYLKAI